MLVDEVEVEMPVAELLLVVNEVLEVEDAQLDVVEIDDVGVVVVLVLLVDVDVVLENWMLTLWLR